MDCSPWGRKEADTTKRLSCIRQYARAECWWRGSYHIKCYEGGLRQGGGGEETTKLQWQHLLIHSTSTSPSEVLDVSIPLAPFLSG